MNDMAGPVIVQSDNTILVEVDNPLFEEARNSISRFSELEKSPEHIHTYRVTPLSLWNAASSGISVEDILSSLETYSKYEIPATVYTTIKEQMKRYGLLRLVMRGDSLVLESKDATLINEILYNKKFKNYIIDRIDDNSLTVHKLYRGHVKQALIKIGFPVEDLAGYEDGDPLDIEIKPLAEDGTGVELRDYQISAVNAFYKGGGPEGGSGVVVLPCGAGKTIVGIGIMAQIKSATLILVTNTVALRQWRDELINRTFLSPDLIGSILVIKKK